MSEDRNPFAERVAEKRRVITVSVTPEQDEVFEKLKANTGIKTDGGMIKLALAHYIDCPHKFAEESQ